jgi:hypothetical protein
MPTIDTNGAEMTRFTILWITTCLAVSVMSCGQEQSDQELILAKINEYTLTLNEFNTLLKEELEYNAEFKLDQDAKRAFLDQIITKELLIQEAKRRQLDRKDKFVRSIERYWESTLIRDLMAMEGQAIEKRTVVSQEEIETRYDELHQSSPNPPQLTALRDQITQQILEEKKRHSLEDWIGRLKSKAQIRVDEKLLVPGGSGNTND